MPQVISLATNAGLVLAIALPHTAALIAASGLIARAGKASLQLPRRLEGTRQYQRIVPQPGN